MAEHDDESPVTVDNLRGLAGTPTNMIDTLQSLIELIDSGKVRHFIIIALDKDQDMHLWQEGNANNLEQFGMISWLQHCRLNGSGG